MTHEPRYLPTAPGAGRCVCSCGWASPVVDDGAMFDPGWKSAGQLYQEHVARAREADAGGFRTFEFCGQTRFVCGRRWPQGGECTYDTYDLEILREHIATVHKTARAVVPPGPTLFDAGGNPVHSDAGEFAGARFAPEREA